MKGQVVRLIWNIVSGLHRKWRPLPLHSIVKYFAANPWSSLANMKQMVKGLWKLLVKCSDCTVAVDEEQVGKVGKELREGRGGGGNRGYWCLQNTGRRIDGSNDRTPLWAPGAHSGWVTSSLNTNDPFHYPPLPLSLSSCPMGNCLPQTWRRQQPFSWCHCNLHQ